MADTERDLSHVFRAATARCPVDLQGCPTADELAALADGTLDGPRRDIVIDLVASCASCAAATHFARASGDGLVEASVVPLPLPQRTPARARSLPRWLPVAAAAVLVAALVPMLLSRDPPSLTRGGAADVSPANDAMLDVPPPEFSWAGTGTCTVTLRDASATRLWQSPPSAGARVAIPEDTRNALRDGTYLWALDCGAGIEGTYRFTVRAH